ncbi:MAG: ABC transporter substrate-binding protein [Alphaproteobacteria bacterium]|nr:ABC transporter substrate-binding protein [Alphaproteobacteria bacterium]
MARSPTRRPVLVALAATAAFALAVVSAAHAQEKSKLTVVFPTPPQTFGIPYYIAKDSGWYAKNGLEIEEQTIAGTPNVIRAMLAGQADVGILVIDSFFVAVAEGAKMKAIGSWQPVADYQLVARKGLIKSIPDMAGKTFAGFSSGNLLEHVPQLLMKKYGKDAKAMAYVSIGGHPERVQAVAVGKADVTMVNTIAALGGVKQGSVEILTTVEKELPGLGYVYSVVTDSGLADPTKRKALEVFTRGAVEGARAALGDAALTTATMLKRTPNVDPVLLRSVIEELIRLKAWDANGGADVNAAETAAKTYHELGIVKRRLGAAEIMDRSVMEKVLKDLGTV